MKTAWSRLRISGVPLVMTSVVVSASLHQSQLSATPAVANQTRLLELREQGLRQYRARAFQKAAQTYEQGYRLAIATQDLPSATRFLSNLGGAYLAVFDYQHAIAALVEGRRLSEKRGDQEFLGTSAINLATAYLQVEHLDDAGHVAEQGLIALEKTDPNNFRTLLLTTLGAIRAHQKKLPDAIALFHQAIDAGIAARNPGAIASAWDCLGEALLRAKQFDAAELPLLEGLRLRSISDHGNLAISCLKLSNLRVEQGDPEEALKLFDKAMALRHQNTGLPPWRIYWIKGRIFTERHQPEKAIGWFQKSVAAWQSWRTDVGAADAIRNDSDSFFAETFDPLIVASLTARSSPHVEALASTEQYRAITVREALTASTEWRKHLDPQYWQTLQQLHTLQVAKLSGLSGAAESQIAHCQQRLTEMEVIAGLPLTRTIRNKTFEKVDGLVALRGIQRALQPDEALLSFYLGDVSAVWAITENGVEFHPLPSKPDLAASARKFREAVKKGSPERDQLGEGLYKQLFKNLSREAECKPFWLIGASDDLFDIPMAALVIARRDGKPVYLVERHATERIPSALMLHDPSAAMFNGPFLGIGDGIYNVADPRWRSDSPKAGTSAQAVSSAKPKVGFELPRLAGSSREIQSCARLWQASGPPVVLTGAASSRARFESSLQDHPAIIHLAAHVIPTPGKSEQPMIDLGLSPQGEPEVLTYDEIANFKVPGSTVVMNGCASAGARGEFGGGVMGLTRAWLLAGAQTVVGSRWPIPDDTGDLFQSFYANWNVLRRSTPPQRIAAQSLRGAQLSILHSNNWRSDPKYWSAFYVFGKD